VSVTPLEAKALHEQNVPPGTAIQASQCGSTRIRTSRSPAAIKKTLPKTSPTLSSVNVKRYRVYGRPWS
jgi:hypothetical protein